MAHLNVEAFILWSDDGEALAFNLQVAEQLVAAICLRLVVLGRLKSSSGKRPGLRRSTM